MQLPHRRRSAWAPGSVLLAQGGEDRFLGNGKTASSYLWRCLVALRGVVHSPGPYPVCTSAAFRWGFPSLTVQGLQYLALHAGHAGSNAHAEISLKFCWNVRSFQACNIIVWNSLQEFQNCTNGVAVSGDEYRLAALQRWGNGLLPKGHNPGLSHDQFVIVCGRSWIILAHLGISWQLLATSQGALCWYSNFFQTSHPWSKRIWCSLASWNAWTSLSSLLITVYYSIPCHSQTYRLLFLDLRWPTYEEKRQKLRY